MKRIYFLLSMTFALVMQGCGYYEVTAEVDAHYTISYKIENRTDQTVTAIVVYGHVKNGDNIDELSKTAAIAPGAIKEIHSEGSICGPNTIVPKYEGPILPIAFSTSTKIFAYSKKLNDDLFNTENWEFSAEEYNYATYLMVLDDDMIENVGYAEE